MTTTPAPSATAEPSAAADATRRASTQKRAAARARVRARARARAEVRAARRETEREDASRPQVPAPAPSFSSAPARVGDPAEETPDTALLGAALGFCALALAGTGVITRVRREAGLA